jgi:hypothetical protein
MLKKYPTATLEKLLSILEQRLAKGNLPEFLRTILQMKTPPHILKWAELLLTQKKYLLIEASRDHGKSWVFSYGYPLFKIDNIAWGQQPINIALISYSEEQAKKNLKRIRQAVEDKPSLRWLYPRKKYSTWDLGELNFSNGCTVDAYGMCSSMRGGHYHLIVVDDPCKDHNTISLDEQRNFFNGVAIPALRRDGQMVVVGTPVNVIDFLWVLEQNPKFPFYKFPAFNENGTPLWPEQYTVEDLQERKEIIGSNVFAREYMLERVNNEQSAFKKEWIKYYTEKPDKCFRIMTVDPAMTEGGDAMGIVITDTDEKFNTYVVYRSSSHAPVRQNIDTIFELFTQYKPDIFGIETFVFQKMLKLWIEEEQDKRDIHFPIYELEKQGVRLTYKARILNLQPKIQSGKIFFRKDIDDPLVSQLLNWEPESKTNKDDELVALAYQVPFWEKPTEFSSARNLEGTFLEEFRNRRFLNQTDNSKIWSDFIKSDIDI